ncbi:MAG: glutamine--fructose-6-phosphate transaminase (isomerizing) [Euryarchaeota archaeon]|nr:glutamine--fructose-6-phosphate transaminase (isomerizing) [Euryarchaeota archaeon]|tara:strand:- start:8478 stop:10295 length:1818 start_codon:yes stop_codon:yes gene_type:complete
MCGIFGYIGHRNASSLLVRGLLRLEYRGYDSSGVVVKNGQLQSYKDIGKISDMASSLPNIKGSMGIAHTRWATHGGVTKENAHPHISNDGKVAIVHNGILQNSDALRKRLKRAGVRLNSETDSEVFCHYIAMALDEGKEPLEALQSVLSMVRGTWGVCVLFQEYEYVLCARNGSPLIIGRGNNEMFISSDPHAIREHTDQLVALEDGQIAKLDAHNFQVMQTDGQEVESHLLQLDEEWGESELGEYPHFMLKEIHEQSQSLQHCISGRLRHAEGTSVLGGLQVQPQDLAQLPHVRLIGCGTALHAAQIGQILIEQWARIPAVSHVASEFNANDPVINPNALHLAISQSGETADTLSAVKEIQRKGADVYGVVNVVGSSIARQCGKGVYIHSGPEQSVASTKAFTNMVGALALFALQLGRSRHLSKTKGKSIIREMRTLPEKIRTYLEQPGPIEQAVELVTKAKSVLFLGRGISSPVASEGALKLMEIAYIPCLAYPAGEMKHGPIALIEENSPVVVIAPNDGVQDKTLNAIHECKARGAKIILIHEEGDSISEIADVSIPIPSTIPMLTPLLSVLPTQLIAYHAALALDNDVDRPRNLAKSVTVE